MRFGFHKNSLELRARGLARDCQFFGRVFQAYSRGHQRCKSCLGQRKAESLQEQPCVRCGIRLDRRKRQQCACAKKRRACGPVNRQNANNNWRTAFSSHNYGINRKIVGVGNLPQSIQDKLECLARLLNENKDASIPDAKLVVKNCGRAFVRIEHKSVSVDCNSWLTDQIECIRCTRQYGSTNRRGKRGDLSQAL